ncbi:MAG: GNAT family N-acetyltransferase [Candidatus Margulisbacteria bacterium]|nr:GNAT family N-acetyltransferase [Candidatus Margulisiibacteriota bacterium]
MSYKIEIVEEEYEKLYFLLGRGKDVLATATITPVSSKDCLPDYLYEFVDIERWKEVAEPTINNEKIAIIEKIAVKDGYQKNGLGTVLMNKIIEEEENVVVWAKSPHGTIPHRKLVSFYVDLGFKVIQEDGEENIMLYSK